MREKSNLKYEYSMIIILGLIWGFVGLNRIGISFLFPIIVPLFHLSNFQAGLLMSDTSCFWAISSWAAGVLGDRYGKKIIFLSGMLFAAITSALLGIAWGFAALLIIRALIGLGDGVGASLGFTMVSDISSPLRRGMNQGIFGSFYTLMGVGLGAIAIPRLAASLGWEWVYPVLNIGMVICVLLVFRYFMDPSAKKETRETVADAGKKEKVSPWQVFEYRPFKFLILINILILTWNILGNGFNALFLTKMHKFSPVMAGSILSGAGVLGGIAMLFIPAISDYLGRKPVIILCSIISGIFYLLFIFGDFSPAVMALIISISGIFGFGQMPLTVATIIAEAVPKRLHATAIGTSNFPSVIIGTLLMPMLGGWAADKWGLSCPLLIAAVAMLLIAVIMFIVPESAPRKVKTEKVASVEAAG